jgi:hypothetical protein
MKLNHTSLYARLFEEVPDNIVKIVPDLESLPYPLNLPI